jgi:hypothetical protein
VTGWFYEALMKLRVQSLGREAWDLIPSWLCLAFAATGAGLRYRMGNRRPNRASLTKQASIAKAFLASSHKAIFLP